MARAAKKTIMKFPEKTSYKPDTAESFVSAADSADLPLLKNEPLSDVSKRSRDILRHQGIPTPKLERWKYTHLARAVKKIRPDYKAVTYEHDSEYVSALDEDSLDKTWVKDALTTPPPQEQQYKDWACWHMENVFLRDGLVIDIPDNTVVEEPLEVSSLLSATGFGVSRIVINVGKNADLTLVERIQSDAENWLNGLVQITVQDGARVRHYRLHDLEEGSVYTQTIHARVQRDATYENFVFLSGNKLVRNQIHVELQGKGGTCNLYGINMLDDKNHADTTITIEHQAPNCNSNQFYRSVLDDMSHGVFQGKVHVHQAAQKTDGYQLANTLIRSKGAEMNTKPELEIYADDVKCSHGATTGQLDEEALFYLTSRGIEEGLARSLLIEAFVREAADKLADDVIAESIDKRIQAWMKQ